jgi:hypothetical protein
VCTRHTLHEVRWIAPWLLCACGRIAFDPVEGGVGADGDAEAVPFCASISPAPLFCSDFDEPGDGFSAWKSTYSDFGTVSLDLAAARSQPRSMVVTTTTQSVSVHAGADTNPLGLRSHVKLAFDVQLINMTPSNEPILAQLSFDDGAVVHGVEYVYRVPPDNSYIEDSVTPMGQSAMYTYYQLDAQSQPSFAWQRITIELFTGAAPRLVTTLDGVTTLDTPITNTTGGAFAISLGVVYIAADSAPWRIRYDNVLVTGE